MIQFYETYSKEEKVQPLAAQLNWSNNVLYYAELKRLMKKNFI